MKLKFTFFFSIICTLLSIGQTNPTLANFSVQQISNSVNISWTIKAGFSCNEVNVEHSTDSTTLTSIYTYPGVCGATSKDLEYSFIQQDPTKNAKNYYRMNLGNYGYSEILQINFSDYGNTGYSIAPNPIINAGKLRFNNSENERFNFEVYDSRGMLVYSQEIIADEIDLSATKFKSGVYFFRLHSTQYSFNGLFSVI